MTKTLVTHNGGFHADDVFAVATLQILDPNIKMVRTRENSLIEKADYVVDVGRIHDPVKGRFDHHQEGGAGKRQNGIPYASFGLVWKFYGQDVSGSDQIAQMIDEKLVQTIDAPDNGVAIFEYKGYPFLYRYGLYDVISSFKPTFRERVENKEGSIELDDEAFGKAVSFARSIIEREIVICRDKIAALNKLAKIYKEGGDRRVLLLDDDYPYQEFVINNKDILLIIVPSRNKNEWKIETARVDPQTFKRRINFPQDWGGKVDEELAQVTGVEGSIVCHNHLFLTVVRTKNEALKIADIVLNNT